VEPEIKIGPPGRSAIGSTIQLTPAVLGTVRLYAEETASIMELVVALGRQYSIANNYMFKAIRAAHPELDGWDFRVEHKTGVVVVTFPRTSE